MLFLSLVLNTGEQLDPNGHLLKEKTREESTLYVPIHAIVPTIYPGSLFKKKTEEVHFMEDSNKIFDEVTSGDYKYGFVTSIDTDIIHRGLDEETTGLSLSKRMSLIGCSSSVCVLSVIGRRWRCLTGHCLRLRPSIIRISFIMWLWRGERKSG